MTDSLTVSRGLSLPLEYVTQTGGLLAVRGAGKSNAARVIAEEMVRAGLPFCAVDPVGSWYGLRSGREGTPDGGLPVFIFGGAHGDVAINRDAGATVADVVVDQRLTCIVDLSGFESDKDKKKFLLAFSQRLYFKNKDPLHLFLEEADDYIPQDMSDADRPLVRAWEDIVRRGRSRGIGCTIITQRSAAINKKVFTQVENLFVLRTTGPQDIKAISEWVKYHDVKDDLLESLSSLDDGEAWVWSPHFLKRYKRFRFNMSKTFDSGATPKNYKGKAARKVATLLDVDVEKLKKRISSTVEAVKNEDPAHLRAEINRLKAELSAKSNVTPINVEVAMAFDRRNLERMLEPIKQVRDMALALNGASKRLIVSHTDLSSSYQAILAELDKKPSPNRIKPTTAILRQGGGLVSVPVAASSALSVIGPSFAGGDQKLAKCPRALLAVLASRYPKTTTASMLSLMSRYSVTSSGFGNGLSTLRTSGYIEGDRTAILATNAGLKANGPTTPFPVGNELIAYWVKNLPKAPGVLFRVLQRRYPTPLTKEEMSKDSEIYVEKGYSVTSSGFGNALSTLRTLELIRSPEKNTFTLNEELFG